MPDLITEKARVDYTSGPFRQKEPALGGESFWVVDLKDGTYRVDNVLYGSERLGLHDLITCEEPEDRDDHPWLIVTGSVKVHDCYRGALKAKSPEALQAFVKALPEAVREAFHCESFFGGSDLFWQIDPPHWRELLLAMETSPHVIAWAGDRTTNERERATS